MKLLKTKTVTLPTELTDLELAAVARELANTVQAIGAETEEQKNLKDQMKAKLSELQARQTRLAIQVSTGQVYREVEISVCITDLGLIEEIRTDNGEVVMTRPPTQEERQLHLEGAA